MNYIEYNCYTKGANITTEINSEDRLLFNHNGINIQIKVCFTYILD